MKKYIIVPDCLDLNRGDQALLWETVRIAKDAGFEGDYYIQSEPENCPQSREYGLKCFSALLPHPSRDKRTNNLNYGILLLFKWGIIALFDLLKSLYLLAIIKHPKMFWTLPKKSLMTVNLYREASAIFVKGGGFLDSYGGLSAPYFIYYHIYSLYIANRLNIPIYFMPNSFGPLDGFTVKWQVSKVLSKCKAIFCRESISQAYMKEYFKDISTINTFDMGFYLDADLNNSKYNIVTKGNSVAITVRPYRFPEYSNGEELYREYLNSFVQFAKHLINNGFFPYFIQHTLAINLHEDDLVAINEITSHLPKGKYGIFKNVDYNCKEMKSVYSHFDYIVGTRFHSVIFSLASKVPAIAIAYGGNKSRGIMRDIDMENYVIDIDKVSSKELIMKFDDLVKNKVFIEEKLECLQLDIQKARTSIVSSIKK